MIDLMIRKHLMTKQTKIKELQSLLNIQDSQKWLADSVIMESVMGSHAYGMPMEHSDMDMYAICIPPKQYIFNDQWINGFENYPFVFEQFIQHGVKQGKNEYDFTVFNITKFFNLASSCNPNIIDSLFVPDNCRIYCDSFGEIVRQNRKEFLSKKCWYTFKGYAYSQLKDVSKMTGFQSQTIDFELHYCISRDTTYQDILNEIDFRDNPRLDKKRECRVGGLHALPYSQLVNYKNMFYAGMNESRRFYNKKKMGYDSKSAVHLFRLMLECEQILMYGDIDMLEHKEQLIAVRNGDMSRAEVEEFFKSKEKSLEKLFVESKLQGQPNMDKIRGILMSILTKYYEMNGTPINSSNVNSMSDKCVADITSVLSKYGYIA